ncbi:ECF RNA polymerase sigma factor SigW [Caloramator mitchellensis]|uniref:ECF RNA polymerase sigma factor SigW n=1 Tax=Caloramator mitchellensis TaxID=908809 RepID=A0A0R3JWP1_CALMK|nr:RNA polymerase sigma factor [Caloramator mitchellensis]KRQ87959.1 ECF RNA polymerase sigma factor SigW [Caloramator mitchellensis]
MDDKELIERIRNGDEDCFVEFVNKHKNKLVMFCYTYTKDINEAEDLSQEVFIKFYQNLRSFRFECSISTYLFRIARNLSIDYIRRKRIKQVFGLFDVLKDDFDYDKTDERIFVRKCILELPENLRTIIVLYYYIGFKESEISNILNISPKAVEGRIYRAKQKLKKELEKGEVLICKEERMN